MCFNYRYLPLLLVIVMFGGCDEQESSLKMNSYDWAVFQQRFVTENGRVMDDAQNHTTHSEGQAYAMLLAVAFDDRKAFDKFWAWSKMNLQVRKNDHLLAWLWDPLTKQVSDDNNATDGDIITAWALVRAANIWKSGHYGKDAKQILTDLKKLEVYAKDYLILLPGAQGFVDQQTITINPSYFIFPAYQELAVFDPSGSWQRLEQDGLRILEEASFGKWRLPADWITISDVGLSIAEDRPPWFSYDAIRIPLYAAWGGVNTTSIDAFTLFWQQFKGVDGVMPDRVDLKTDFIHFDHKFRAGYAINKLCRHILPSNKLDSNDWPFLVWREDTSYFDASLMLLTQLAWQESSLRELMHKSLEGGEDE